MGDDRDRPRVLGDPYSPHGILLRAGADLDLITDQARQFLRGASRSVVTVEHALEALRILAVLVSGLVDTWSMRLAARGGEPDPNEAYDRAEGLVADLDLPPTGGGGR